MCAGEYGAGGVFVGQIAAAADRDDDASELVDARPATTDYFENGKLLQPRYQPTLAKPYHVHRFKVTTVAVAKRNNTKKIILFNQKLKVRLGGSKINDRGK